MTQLSVNVDHVATLRQARRATYPSVLEAALAAEAAGASGITVHLRSDRRHIQDEDLSILKRHVQGKLNVEMAATDEMLQIAIELAPDQVTLVPEAPEEITTEGGLDLATQSERIAAVAPQLHETGILVSLFLDPDLSQIDRLHSIGSDVITGFEINTDTYTKSSSEDRGSHLADLRAVALKGHQAGFAVYAGHGLTTENVHAVASLPHMEELNIGHSLVARSVMIGIGASVQEMIDAMQSG